MQHIRSASPRAALAAALVLLTAAPAFSQREETAPPGPTVRPATDSPANPAEAARRSREESGKPVVYQPPRRGSPRGRVAGGSRGGTALPQPLALAPNHVAETLSASPSLFWHLDGTPPETARIVFTLIEADGIDPIVEHELPLPSAAGIQRVRLSDFGVALRPDVEYEWSISLRPAGEDHTADRVDQGFLRRVDAGALADRPPSARTFAEQGLWYDALESLGDALDEAPADPDLLAQRDSLLRQAGGLDAALSARSQARP